MMIFFYAVIIISPLFILSFIKQLVRNWKFLYVKTSSEEDVFPIYLPKKYVVKKKLMIHLSKKKRWLQSKVFYAKFLMEKPFKNLSISIKFLIEEIYTKLSFNFNYLNAEVAFDKLKNAGIFNGKPIYKIIVKSKEKLEKELQALNVVYKFFDFRAIFLLEENLEEELIKNFIYTNALRIDYKIISLKDININLLYEINKLNLNYKVEKRVDKIEDFSFYNLAFDKGIQRWNMQEYTSKNKEVIVTKFVKYERDFLNSNVGYFIKFNATKSKKRMQFSINYMLKSEFFNMELQTNFLEIKYYETFLEKSRFCFSSNLKRFEIQKCDGKVFLSLHFSVPPKDKSKLFFLLEDFDDIKNLTTQDVSTFVLENNLKTDKFFKFKIYTKDKDFNEFFNKKLKSLIIKEKLQNKENNFILPYTIRKTLEQNFNFPLKKTLEFSSYSNLYNFIINEILGIQEKSSVIFFNPKKEYIKKSFKLVFLGQNNNYNSVYVEQNSDIKGLQVGDIFYTNLKFVDLSLINKNAKLSI